MPVAIDDLPQPLRRTIELNGKCPEAVLDEFMRLLDTLGLRFMEFITASRSTLVGTVTDGTDTYVARLPMRPSHAAVYVSEQYGIKGVGPSVIAVTGDMIVMEQVQDSMYLNGRDVSAHLDAITAAGLAAEDSSQALTFREWITHKIEESSHRADLHPEGEAVLSHIRRLGEDMTIWNDSWEIRHGDLSTRNILTAVSGRPSIIDPSPVIGPVEIDALKLFRSCKLPDSMLYEHFNGSILDTYIPFYELTGELYKASCQ